MMHQQEGWTYFLANRPEGDLYAGITTDLKRRVLMHRQGVASHFTRSYGIASLVWYERHDHIEAAAAQLQRFRHRRREWKLALITHANPDWLDLYDIITALPQWPRLSSTNCRVDGGVG